VTSIENNNLNDRSRDSIFESKDSIENKDEQVIKRMIGELKNLDLLP